MSDLKIFSVLASDINSKWEVNQYTDDSFSKIAYECLLQRMDNLMGYESILKWLMSATKICEQSSLGNSFGQPPFTIYSDERFRIEALFWHVGAATVHHHTFSGAFSILQGETIHTLFDFKEKLQCYDHFRIGKLSINKVELLKTGDVREIIPGGEMIHSTFHLDMPTVTVVIRTHCHGKIKTELEYRPPGIAVNSCYFEPLLVKKVQALEFLQKVQANEQEKMLEIALESTDIFGNYLLLRQFYSNRAVNSNDSCISIVKSRYGDFIVSSILQSIEEEKRRISIYKLRSSVIDSEQRFFLALLLNLPNLPLIVKFVNLRYPEYEPLPLICRWCEDIVNQNSKEVDVKLFILILKALINGKSYNLFLEEISKNLQYKELLVDNPYIEISYKKISSSVILKPLFILD